MQWQFLEWLHLSLLKTSQEVTWQDLSFMMRPFLQMIRCFSIFQWIFCAVFLIRDVLHRQTAIKLIMTVFAFYIEVLLIVMMQTESGIRRPWRNGFYISFTKQRVSFGSRSKWRHAFVTDIYGFPCKMYLTCISLDCRVGYSMIRRFSMAQSFIDAVTLWHALSWLSILDMAKLKNNLNLPYKMSHICSKGLYCCFLWKPPIVSISEWKNKVNWEKVREIKSLC